MSEVQSTPFTVKWVYRTDGGLARERVIEADQINVAYDERPPEGEVKQFDCKLGIYTVPRTGLVVLGNPEKGEESMALTFGKVYVMNRDGKTVATYNLADPEGHTAAAAIHRAQTFEPDRLATLKRQAGG